MKVPALQYLFVVLALLSSCLAWVPAAAHNSALRMRSILRMSDTPAAPAAPEWVGAKKFSMKDRYTNTVMTNEQIAKILPHRYPFLLVDRVVEFEAGKRAVGIKCVTANEPQFTGHFPDRPIMPGVLMVEAMAQLGNYLMILSDYLTL